MFSEIIGIQNSVETGALDKSVNFYYIRNAMDYGISGDYKALGMATKYENCRLVTEKNIDSENDKYQSCTQIILEAWDQTLALAYGA